MLHLFSRGRRPAAAPASGGATGSLQWPPSHTVLPCSQLCRAEWAMHARRPQALLPSELAWAAPVLNPDAPAPCVCSADGVVALLR
jgi:hypothetical protein